LKKQRKIKDILLFSHSIISTGIALILLIWIAFTQIQNIREDLDASMRQLSNSIVYGVSSEIEKMNTASLSILYSNLVKNSFENYVDASSSSVSTQYTNQKILGDLLNMINIQNSSMSEITLYGLNKGSYTLGANSNQMNLSAKDQPWYEQSLQNKGKKVISLLYSDPELTARTTYKKNSQYLTLVRQFFYNYNTPQGFVEVKQNTDTVFQVFDTLQPSPIYDFVILNAEGLPIFPVEKQSQDFTTYFSKYKETNANDQIELIHPENNKKEIVQFQSIDNCGFVSLIMVNKQRLYQPVYLFILKFFLISLATLIGVIWISYYLSKRITMPIYAIYNNVKNIDIHQKDFMPNDYDDSNILEINALWVALRVSHIQLQDSMHKLILSEQQDMQSKMLALQSQMNPHFLHNSLSALLSMIEEGKIEDSKKLCQSMSTILRYISSSKESLVTLEEDLENTETYLNCMKSRYGDDLFYTFDVADELLDIKIPKLCTQLLAENSIKYVTLKAAPWHINIHSYQDATHWYIRVTDNGFGFKPHIIDEIQSKIQTINSTHLLPNLELNGMGLINIYIRLKQLYNVPPIFDIRNLENEGCEVIIGGLLE